MRQYYFTTEVGLMMPKPRRGIKKRLMNKIRSLFSRHKSPSRRLRHSETSSNPVPTQLTMTEKLSSGRNTQPGKHAPRGIRFSRRAVQRSKYLREKFGIRKTVMGFSPRVGSITEEDENEITLWRLAENAENVISNGLAWLQSDFKDYDSDDDDDCYDNDEKILQKWIENNSCAVMQDNNNVDADDDDKPLSDDDDKPLSDDDVFTSDKTLYKVERSDDDNNDGDYISGDHNDDKTDDYDDSSDDDDDSDGIIGDNDADCYAISECGEYKINYDSKSNNTLRIDGDDHNNNEVLQHNANDDNKEHGSTHSDNRPGSSVPLITNNVTNGNNNIQCKRCDISKDDINNDKSKRGDNRHHKLESKKLIACKGKESAINASSLYKCNYMDINSNDCLHHLTITDSREGPKDKLFHHDTIADDIKTIQTVSMMHKKGQDNEPRDLANRETANCQNTTIFHEHQRRKGKKSYNNVQTFHNTNGSVCHGNYNQFDDDDNDYVWVSDVIRDVTSASKSDVISVDYDGRSSHLKISKDGLQNRAGSGVLDDYDSSTSSNNKGRTKEKDNSVFQQLPNSSIRGEPETIEETDTVLTYTKPEYHEAGNAKKLSCGDDRNDMCLDNVLNSVKEEIEGVWTRISTLENDFHLARTTMNDMKTSKKK